MSCEYTTHTVNTLIILLAFSSIVSAVAIAALMRHLSKHPECEG
jgi:hypothetical protein